MLGEHLNDCPRSTLKLFVDVHMKYIKDQYSKVIKEVQDSLRTFISYKPAHLEPHLPKLIPAVLSHMIDDSEYLASSSADLINDLCSSYKTNALIPILVE